MRFLIFVICLQLIFILRGGIMVGKRYFFPVPEQPNLQSEVHELITDRPSYTDTIKRHEGYRDRVYLCSEGVPTVGWGHTFPKGEAPPVGTQFTYEQTEEFFRNDMEKVEKDYNQLKLTYPGLKQLTPTRQGVVKNMIFNLGLSRLRGFKKMLQALNNGDYNTAADEMLDSKWAKQVGRRAIELSNLMRKGDVDGNN